MRKFLILTVLAAAFLAGCNKENTKDDTAPSTKPNFSDSPIFTADALDITENTATLCGYINLTEDSNVTGYGVVVSEESSPSPMNGSIFETTEIDGNKRFSVKATALKPATRYYYKAFYNKKGSYNMGEAESFTTAEYDAGLSTGEATDVLALGATLTGHLKLPRSGDLTGFSVWFQYSSTASTLEELQADGHKVSGTIAEDGSFSGRSDVLERSTEYHFVAGLTISGLDIWGDLKSFTTLSSMSVDGAEDLGLKVLWATCNLGASAPQETGDLFAWGETEPKDSDKDSWLDYKWCEGSATTLSKYNVDPNLGAVDNQSVLSTGPNGDDAASKRLGGGWHIPTPNDWDELQKNCQWTWKYNWNNTGVSGHLVKGPNGHTIFLPSGMFWTSSLLTSDCTQAICYMIEDGDDVTYFAARDRFEILPIRPVTN